ncbi:hypothetical protein B0H10DRAFT_1949552 [Mycena sp. CBHHK59/15]|nr:hypothetical protein B0H10DRAFT_1949552 [Mycena sp. CBHHK59/15]
MLGHVWVLAMFKFGFYEIIDAQRTSTQRLTENPEASLVSQSDHLIPSGNIPVCNSVKIDQAKQPLWHISSGFGAPLEAQNHPNSSGFASGILAANSPTVVTKDGMITIINRMATPSTLANIAWKKSLLQAHPTGRGVTALSSVTAVTTVNSAMVVTKDRTTTIVNTMATPSTSSNLAIIARLKMEIIMHPGPLAHKTGKASGYDRRQLTYGGRQGQDDCNSQQGSNFQHARQHHQVEDEVSSGWFQGLKLIHLVLKDTSVKRIIMRVVLESFHIKNTILLALVLDAPEHQRYEENCSGLNAHEHQLQGQAVNVLGQHWAKNKPTKAPNPQHLHKIRKKQGHADSRPDSSAIADDDGAIQALHTNSEDEDEGEKSNDKEEDGAESRKRAP